MPTPQNPKETPVREEPEEVGASGGAPTEAKPPHTKPQTLEELDVWLAKRIAEEISEEYKFTLITVEPDGNVEANFYDDLKDVAAKILEQIEEEVSADLQQDLPETSTYWEARLITAVDGGKFYYVEEEWNRWVAIHIIPAHKATLYTTNVEVLSTISNGKLYVRGKAVITRDITYFKIDIDRAQIKDLEAELLFLLGESL
jgi:hypothetical protein